MTNEVIEKFPAVMLEIAQGLVDAIEQGNHAEASYMATQMHAMSKIIAQNESGKALDRVRYESFGPELVKEVNAYLEGETPGGYV